MLLATTIAFAKKCVVKLTCKCCDAHIYMKECWQFCLYCNFWSCLDNMLCFGLAKACEKCCLLPLSLMDYALYQTVRAQTNHNQDEEASNIA